MNAISLNLLANATVLKNESRKGFGELVRQQVLCIAPHDTVEQAAVGEISSATWRLHRLRAIERKAIDLELANQSALDDLERLLHACGALAGKNPNLHLLLQRYGTRLQDILRRSLARIRPLRQIGEKKDSTKPPPRSTPRVRCPLGPPPGRNVLRSLYPCGSGHTSPSHGLHPLNPKKHRLRHPTETREKPKKTQEKPTETQEKPAETHGKPTAGVPCPSTLVLSRFPARSGGRVIQSTESSWYPQSVGMLRKLFSLVLPVALTAVVLLGECPECQPRETSDHSCCDPASQRAPAKQCPDRNEILRHYDNPASVTAPVLFVALAMLPQPAEVAPVRTVVMATADLPRIDGPPDLFLRNSAILI